MKETTASKSALSEEDKVWAASSYLWIFCLIPLLIKRKNSFIQYHAKQGLVLFGAEIVIAILSFIPLLGFVGWVVAIIFSIMGIVNAVTGKYWEMPWLGKFAKKITL
ncbi:MAG: hypothetical protein ABIJ81_02930 [Patescibacteria group bacterium]